MIKKIVKTTNLLKIALVLLTTQILSPSSVLAEGIAVEPKAVKIEDVITNIRNYFLGAVIIVCVFMILWAAFNYVTSGGDEKKVESAKKTIYYAVIGLIVALLAVSIVGLVRGVIEGGASGPV
jgi:fumarate reductase subunit D